MLCYLKFPFKQKFCGEEYQYTANPFLFFFLKKNRPRKQKKIINISYSIMVLMKMRLLILLLFSQYGLASRNIVPNINV